MDFNFNSAFKPMGFPGMPQMHFPTFNSMSPQPMIQPAVQPTTQVPPIMQGQPGYGPQTNPHQGGMAPQWKSDYQQARQDWRQQMPQYGQMDPNFHSQMMDWRQQRPDMQQYRQPGMLPTFGG